MPKVNQVLKGAKSRLLPPSSRSFHSKVDRVLTQLDEVCHNVRLLPQLMDHIRLLPQFMDHMREIELLQLETLESIRELREQNEQLQREQADLVREQNKVLQARVMHNRFYLEELYRSEDESQRQATARLFASLPPATGAMRISQLATARLMHELDLICAHLGIDYWVASGGLVATVYRGGAIPWDDDIDIGMMREDVERLAAYLEEVNEEPANSDKLGYGFQMTVIYDCIVKVRQVRFSLIDQSVPCFIDVVGYDRANVMDDESNLRMWELHNQMVAELDDMARDGGPLEYWVHHPFLRAAGSSGCAQVMDVDWDALDTKVELQCVMAIQSVMDRYAAQAREESILLEQGADVSATVAISYGLESLCEKPWRPFFWDPDVLFPVRRMPYEGYEVNVPNKASEACDIDFGRDTPYLPNDILGHSHFAVGAMSTEQTLLAMRRFAEA